MAVVSRMQPMPVADVRWIVMETGVRHAKQKGGNLNTDTPIRMRPSK